MIEYNGKNYVLRYSQQRIEMIENAARTPLMASLTSNRGMLSLSELKTFFAYGLKEEGSDIFVPVKTALEIAAELIEASGYATVLGTVLESLQRDCPFFFQGL